MCPNASTTTCSTKISPQSAHLLPSVNPVVVHVGATAGTTSAVCPFALITFCFSVIVLHTTHTFPFDNPSVKHVAGYSAISTT